MPNGCQVSAVAAAADPQRVPACLSACLPASPPAKLFAISTPGSDRCGARPQASGAAQQLQPIQRVFVFMTLMHSETLADQDVSGVGFVWARWWLMVVCGDEQLWSVFLQPRALAGCCGGALQGAALAALQPVKPASPPARPPLCLPHHCSEGATKHGWRCKRRTLLLLIGCCAYCSFLIPPYPFPALAMQECVSRFEQLAQDCEREGLGSMAAMARVRAAVCKDFCEGPRHVLPWLHVKQAR